MFTFTPLLGAQSSASAAAVQSLLEFDGGVKVLIDVGWDSSFDVERLRELERQVPTISVLLLTHATLSHVGAYVHCCKNIPLFSRIPVYATQPVISLGRTLLQDLYASTPLASSLVQQASFTQDTRSDAPRQSENTNILLQPPSSEEIANFFSVINSLKYSQPHQPIPAPNSPPLDGLTITAYCAGHSLGGTIWHIQHASESVIYAVDWHQARENVFPGAAWLSSSGAAGAEVLEQLKTPTALVCSSKGGNQLAQSGGRAQRDELLLEQIRNTVKLGGSVLLPMDTSARVLEVAYLLERAMRSAQSNAKNAPLNQAKVFLVNSTASMTMKYVSSMLEWMDESIVREFENAGNLKDGQQQSGPFDFKFIKLIERKSQLDRALTSTAAKVFLAADASLEWGFARDVLASLAPDKRNLLILPDLHYDKPDTDNESTTSAQQLWNLYHEKGGSDSKVVQCEGESLLLKNYATSALGNQELPVYQQYLQARQQRDGSLKTGSATELENSNDVVDDVSSESSDDDDEDTNMGGKILNISAQLNQSSKHKLGLTDEELGINILVRRKDVYDYDSRARRGRDKTFPFVAKRKRMDDFGESIRPEDYLRAEERDEVDGLDMRATNTVAATEQENLGSKRSWDDRAGAAGSAKRRGSAPITKRRKANEAHSNVHDGDPHSGKADATAEEDESEESDYEPDEVKISGPCKVTFDTERITVNLKITAIDLAGMHDKRSLQMLIPLIRPRKLILTRGSKDETMTLAEDCRKMLKASNLKSSTATDSDVMAPGVGFTVDASVDTNAFTIKLSRSLFRNLKWQNVRGMRIATVNGTVEFETSKPEDDSSSENAAKKPKVLEDNKQQSEDKEPDMQAEADADAAAAGAAAKADLLPVLTELPANAAGTGLAATTGLHVGDLRLAELRKIMQTHGHVAEFKGEGTLLVDGFIAIKKSGLGKIEVECGGLAPMGTNARQLGASFWDVKRRIYDGLAVVAAR